MIVRLWRARLRQGTEAELLERLRSALPDMQGPRAPLDFTYGFRREAGATHFLTLSVWLDFATLREATGGDPSQSIQQVSLEDLCETSGADTYERLPPAPATLDLSDGRVLGVVTGSAKPNHESVAQSMVDRSAGAALAAGAVTAHLGRRLSGRITELVVVVVWPTRATMTRFVRSRNIPAVDPAFAAHLSKWRFETYNAVSPDRLLVPPDGPAVLVLDADGRYVDATAGIESVLGIPSEVLYGRSIDEMAIDDDARADVRRRFLDDGDGAVELLRPDGATVRVQYRTVANTPGPGLHAAVLTLPGAPRDPRPVHEILAEDVGHAEVGV
jgi:PAS domain-containing protein